MAKLQWDKIGDRVYETGVSQAVLYKPDKSGVYSGGIPWNGLISVSENPTGAESNPLYADDIKYLDLRSAEEFAASIEAYTFPNEFAECDGSVEIAPGVVAGQQTRKLFGLSYKTKIGNDVDSNDHGYKLHLVYGATAAPTEKSYQSVNDSPEAITFSWELTTTAIDIPGHKPSASLEINSLTIDAEKLAAIEALLYGGEVESAQLPSPTEIMAIITGE